MQTRHDPTAMASASETARRRSAWARVAALAVVLVVAGVASPRGMADDEGLTEPTALQRGAGWTMAEREEGASIFHRVDRRFELSGVDVTLEVFSSVDEQSARDVADHLEAFVRQVYPEMRDLIGREARYTRAMRVFLYADPSDCYRKRRAESLGLGASWFDARRNFVHLFVGEIEAGPAGAHFVPYASATRSLQHEATHGMLRWFYAYKQFAFFNRKVERIGGRIPEMLNEGFAMVYQDWRVDRPASANRAGLHAQGGRNRMVTRDHDGASVVRDALWVDLPTLWAEARSRRGWYGDHDSVHPVQVYEQGELFVHWLRLDPHAQALWERLRADFDKGAAPDPALLLEIEDAWYYYMATSSLVAEMTCAQGR